MVVKNTLEFLRRNPEQRFTAREIAEWITKNYKKECQEKKERSKKPKSDKDLFQQITAEISHVKKHPEIKATEDRPQKYYYTKSSDGKETGNPAGAAKTEIVPDNADIKEEDLYPVLIKFLWLGHKIHSKRIDERRSSNSSGRRGNKWLYPDVVGLEDLSKDWHREIKDCVKEHSDKKARLWSFEAKKNINRSNVRECYFQAVSNSSWANFGYLVANEVKVDALEELRILAGLLGIGLIKLDLKNPSESQIMIPAKERLGVDWNTANRLAKENRDFLNCIKSVREFYQTGRVNPGSWDTKN